jgi:hypothetical protein
MECAVRDDPEPADFAGCLLRRCIAAGAASGGAQAMALDVFEEWRLAGASRAFGEWLA